MEPLRRRGRKDSWPADADFGGEGRRRHWYSLQGRGRGDLARAARSRRRMAQGGDFRHRFTLWLDQLKRRRDVFLGYCSNAHDTANAINLFLTKLGVSVLDWADFSAAGNILDEIERASSMSSLGIFLFTQDDLLEEEQEDRAAPRDNVVFEAGYFTQSKGRERVLIIRESRVKMPADVGGNIYLPLKDRKDIRSIETQLRSFVEKRL